MANQSGNVMSNIVAALKGIRKDAGFRTNVALVTEAPLSFGRVGTYPALSVQTVRERSTYLLAKRRRRVIRVQITGFVRVGAGADKFAAARDLAADIEAALLADPTRGGSAAVTTIPESTITTAAQEEGARVVCVAEIVAHEKI